jgi:diaminohydroxyphosphoribosylaminopyrimidine deaminase/5-amino-6-(5-phosphoribosylamino)uracil reductase
MLSGVSVKSGTLADECGELIRAFSKWITGGMPYVIAKAGQSLDGRITRPAGESQWLTSNAARIHGRRLRLRADAIIVGAETVRKDNPRLTLRDGCAATGKDQPWRIILTRSGDIPADSHLLTDAFKDRTLIMQGVDLREVLVLLGERGIVTVLIEGGGIILGQAFREQLVDEVHWYIAPLLCGGGRPSLAGPALPASVELDHAKVMPMGDNVHISGFVRKVSQTA